MMKGRWLSPAFFIFIERIYMRRAFVLFLATCLAWSSSAQQITYPANDKPTESVALFAKGVVTDGLNNRDLTISPDGNEMYFTLQQGFVISIIVRMYKKDGQWQKAEVAPFSGRYNDLEASFSPDGKRIWFASDRPVDASDSVKDFDIWYVDRTASGWGQPVHAGFEINSPRNEFYPSVGKSGNLYFTARLPSGNGREDIVVSEWRDGKYAAPVILPEAINSKGDEFNAFVDPDEKYIIFTGYGRADDMGRGDLYRSDKDENGNWKPAKNLGPGVNSKHLDYCPYVSPDKKTLFFSSNRPLKQTPFDKQENYQTILDMMKSPGNGSDDIYWILLPK